MMNIELSENQRRKLHEIIANVLDVSLDHLTPGTKLSDLGMDSMDDVEILMTIEEQFNVNIPEEMAERILTVGDAEQILASLLMSAS